MQVRPAMSSVQKRSVERPFLPDRETTWISLTEVMSKQVWYRVILGCDVGKHMFILVLLFQQVDGPARSTLSFFKACNSTISNGSKLLSWWKLALLCRLERMHRSTSKRWTRWRRGRWENRHLSLLPTRRWATLTVCEREQRSDNLFPCFYDRMTLANHPAEVALLRATTTWTLTMTPTSRSSSGAMHSRSLLRHPKRDPEKSNPPKTAEYPSDQIWVRVLLWALPSRLSSFSTCPPTKDPIWIRAFLVCWRRLIPAFPVVIRHLWTQLPVFAQASTLFKNRSIFSSLAAIRNCPHHELQRYLRCPAILSKRTAWRFPTFWRKCNKCSALTKLDHMIACLRSERCSACVPVVYPCPARKTSLPRTQLSATIKFPTRPICLAMTTTFIPSEWVRLWAWSITLPRTLCLVKTQSLWAPLPEREEDQERTLFPLYKVSWQSQPAINFPLCTFAFVAPWLRRRVFLSSPSKLL